LRLPALRFSLEQTAEPELAVHWRISRTDCAASDRFPLQAVTLIPQE
jgi:hypothetical protein